MDPDQFLVLGLTLVAFAIPAGVNAYSDQRWPIFGGLLAVIGGAGIACAFVLNPDGYELATLDQVIVGVIGGLING